jgi:predicted nucleotidyltransferase
MEVNTISLPEDLLETISNVMIEESLDFFIVGAIARDINLSHHIGLESPRTTEDLDIAIHLAHIEQFQTIISKLIQTGNFETTANNPLRLLYKNTIELDLLPFGELETDKREVYIPIAGKSFILSVPGLKEVQELSKVIELNSGLKIHYCPLEGIVLLKLISWHENPARTKDREDIYHICSIYFEYAADEIYTNAFELLNHYNINDYKYKNLVASHYLGYKVRQITKENLSLLNILNHRLKLSDGLLRALLNGINHVQL